MYIGLPVQFQNQHQAVQRAQKALIAKPTPTNTAKAPRTATSDRQSESESDSSGSSSDESDDSDTNVTPEPSPLPPARPNDPEGAIKYDTMRISWFPRNKRPSAGTIRSAIIQFSELVKTVRDAWKSRSEALKAAENQNQGSDVPTIKKDVQLQRRLIEDIVNTALQVGHPSIVERYVTYPLSRLSSFYALNCHPNYGVELMAKIPVFLVILFMTGPLSCLFLSSR